MVSAHYENVEQATPDVHLFFECGARIVGLAKAKQGGITLFSMGKDRERVASCVGSKGVKVAKV